MADWTQIGKLLLVLSLALAILGGVIILSARLFSDGKLPWLGRLPGDIRIERKGFSCFFPLATSIIISLLLTIVLNVIIRLLKR